MQINRLLVAVDRLDQIASGVTLTFHENVALLDENDAIVVRLTDGSERLLIVRKARPDCWIATCSVGTAGDLRLELVDGRSLRIGSVPPGS